MVKTFTLLLQNKTKKVYINYIYKKTTTTNFSATSNRKTTLLQIKESMSHKSWKNRIQMWQLVISIPKKEQVPKSMLESLCNNTKAEKAASEFTAAESIIDEGIELLISKLNSILQSKMIDEAYDTYSKLINFSHKEMI